MLQCRDMKFSEMKNKDVIDNTGQRIGRVIDFLFNWEDGEVKLKSVVLGGSRIEEFLESIGVRPDIDPFFPLEVVDRFEDDKLYLKVKYEKLSEPVKLGEKEMRLSDLSKIKIIDSEKGKVGNIIDVWFDKNCRMWFIIGGGFFEELFERLHFTPDIDILVPQDFVTNISSEQITLKYSKAQLETTCEEACERFDRERALKGKPVDSRYSFMRLGDPSRRVV